MNVARTIRRVAALFIVAGLAACSRPPPQALGTLEYDRITLPAPVAERIVAIDVREGEQVSAGQALLQLDPAHTRSELAAAEAQAQQQPPANQGEEEEVPDEQVNAGEPQDNRRPAIAGHAAQGAN